MPVRPFIPEIDGWIIAVGALAGAACAIPGAWLLVRGRVMAGDAVTHAVLPGIAGAFLAFQSRDPLLMLAGAAVSGVACLLLAVVLERTLRVDRGAALGVAFTAFFAIGLVMIVQGADRVDLDPSCVLYGALELTPIDVVTISVPGLDSFTVPRAVPILLVALVVCGLVSWILFKELRLSAFDPGFAAAIGARPLVVDLLLAALVAMVSVAAFESVGSILVVALLAALPAGARMLTSRLGPMLLLGPALAVVASIVGHLAAIAVPPLASDALGDTSSAGSIAVVAGLLFLACALIGPERGIVLRVLRERRLRERIAREELLALLWRSQERGLPVQRVAVREHFQQMAVGRRVMMAAINALARSGLVDARDEQRILLTTEGSREASRVIRSHRLWESYLTEQASLRPDHVHATASRLEHVTGDALAAQLASETNATIDPHGHQIPQDEARG
ncbi:MAG: metal ABC transporter permease [Planctomycetota bacterium]|nr:metal ABC transporter permease [Planctomycetota bacterium]MDA1106345.1 metal ABC transporter permease [Planctomycetota bacterium]